MKIENKSGHGLSHVIIEDKKPKTYYCKNGGILEVPEEIAKLWLKIKGVKEYADPVDFKKLQEENAKLQAKVKTSKKNKK